MCVKLQHLCHTNWVGFCNGSNKTLGHFFGQTVCATTHVQDPDKQDIQQNEQHMICSISGIRLPQSALTGLDVNGTHYKVCTYLLRQWLLFAGPVYWDGTSLCKDILKDFVVSPSPNQDKTTFFVKEFTTLLDVILYNEDLDNISPMVYTKVLLGALLRYDATLSGILAHETYQCVSLLLSDPLYDIPGHRYVSIDLLGELADLLYATFVTLVQDDIEASISLLNAFGKVQSLVLLPVP